MWSGNHTFICNGRLMFGPSIGYLLSTSLLCSFLWTTMIFLVNSFISFETSPVDSFDSNNLGSPAMLWKFWFPILLLVMNQFLLFSTALVEPGIIPFCKPTLVTLALSQELRVYDRTAFCGVCQVLRPPRSRHCRYVFELHISLLGLSNFRTAKFLSPVQASSIR